MKRSLTVVGACLFLIHCSHNPHKAEKLETKMDQAETSSGSQKVGLKNGEMMVQSKVALKERLRDLQNEVYGLEDKVYGSRKYDSKGLYGDLRGCRSKLASRQFGGSGTLLWAEPLDRVTDKEEEMALGLDESNQLVGVSEEYLRDRLSRFAGYKKILQKREDEFSESLEQCQAQVKEKDIDTSQSKRVAVTETSKLTLENDNVNQFMCRYVKEGASLQSLMMNAFGHGWMKVSDFNRQAPLLAAQIRSQAGEERSNGLILGGWRLAFDEGAMTLEDVLAGKDARLKAWSTSSTCVAKSDGRWNP